MAKGPEPHDPPGPVPAETPEENTAPASQVARNQEAIGEIDRLMREHVVLLGGRNRATTDLGRAERQAERLKQLVAVLRPRRGRWSVRTFRTVVPP